jgi:hypothetical protein
MLTLNIGGREFPILGDEQTLRSKNPDEEEFHSSCVILLNSQLLLQKAKYKRN